LKRFLLAAIVAALPCFPAEAVECDYVSYIIKNGQCINLTNPSAAASYPQIVTGVATGSAPTSLEDNPITLQNMKVQRDRVSRREAELGAPEYFLVGEVLNQSARSINGGVIATVSIYQQSTSKLVTVKDVEIPQDLRSGSVTPFKVEIAKTVGAVIIKLESVRRL